MIDFSKLSLVSLGELHEHRAKKQVREQLIAEGRAAFRAGLPISECPAFAIEDFGINWRKGWRMESLGK